MLLQSLLRPVLTPIMRGIFDPAQSVSAAWSPLSLWPNGIATPGMWISPRTLTSEWQDYTGTTPVVTPGTVADTSNPVGLALDIRAGAPEVLGPELVTNGGVITDTTGWTAGGLVAEATIAAVDGKLRVTKTPGSLYPNANQTLAVTTGGPRYLLTADYDNPSGLVVFMSFSGTATTHGTATSGTASCIITSGNPSFQVGINDVSGVAGQYIDFYNISVREIPGNHMLQSTSAARPLMSAYDGQTLGPGDTYSSTGYPIFQLYDGVDDGMATAAFTAGTLISGMDCMIPVRRDSAAACVAGLYNGIADATKFFGMAESASGSGCVGSGAGTPTVWVDGVQLSGGTAVTRGTLHTALTVGDWHILEFRGLDLSAWTAAGFGLYTSYVFPGARGDIMLYPSTDSTADKDAARQYLADYYGVTLP
mgnify:CR=1 FL=1